MIIHVRPCTALNLTRGMAVTRATILIVFHDNITCSEKLVKKAATVFGFVPDKSKRKTYNFPNIKTEHCYNSSGYYDEYM